MKFAVKALSLVLGFGIAFSASAESLKDQITTELGLIKRVFETGYAPVQWKKEHLGWDLNSEYQKQLSALDQKESISALDYHTTIASFLGSAHDYHVGFSFFSTERSDLPFAVTSTDGHVYVIYVDTTKLSADIMAPGDEILTWNDKPVMEEIGVVLAQNSWGVPSTDQRLSELYLTKRVASIAVAVPQGRVNLTFKHDNKIVSRQMNWAYTPETIPWNGSDSLTQSVKAMSLASGQKVNDYRHLQMAWGMWKAYQKVAGDSGDDASDSDDKDDSDDSDDSTKPAPPPPPENPFKIGGRKTFVPELGQIIWQTAAKDAFNAYIYRNEAGKIIGYIRIADYEGDTKRFAEFKAIIKRMEGSTDALVIDEVNNPGGSLFYVYALMTVLSPTPIQIPQHSITLWPEQVKESVDDLAKLATVKTNADAVKVIGDLDGYPVDLDLAQALLAYDNEVVANWKAKVHLTKPLYLWGLDRVNPDVKVSYSKPLLVLVNELDFSGGDFFPAILQDNKRAKIFGTRTSGAGGYILDVKFPSHLGLESFSFTGSIARRIDGNPIENLGVTPDPGCEYTFTAKDMTKGFTDYKDAVNKTVQGML